MSQGPNYLMNLRHILAQHRKRFLFAVPIYVTLTDEINQNASRSATNRDRNLQGNSKELAALSL